MQESSPLPSWPRVPASDESVAQSKRRLPKSSVRVLQNWLSAHSYHPYPNDAERTWLQAQTGLTSLQITNWFSNARRRQKLFQDTDTTPKVPIVAARSVPDLRAAQRWDALDPLTRWRNSPPEQEHVPIDTLAKAIREGSAVGVAGSNATQSTEPQLPAPRAASEASFESWDSLQSSGSSSSYASTAAGSAGNVQLSQFRNLHGRRRRRQALRSRTASINYTDLSLRSHDKRERRYQCTFCTDTFKTKFDWVRHEGSLHLALEKWVCLYRGTTYHGTTGVARCVFCDEPDPTESHLALHRYQECTDKPLPTRTFFRRDHLRQHLRLVHGADRLFPSMHEWKMKVTKINCRCGFCDQRFQNWDERNEHLAEHFREGAQMKDWKGCRGLDPVVALHVENAIPPYLIGTESHEFEPFSASTNCASHEVIQPRSRQPTRFEDLTTHLAEYVRSAIANGVTVTDETVRRKARLFMFGDDDAWNQTPADNREWLRLFKIGLNLGSSQNRIHTQLDHDHEAYSSPDKQRSADRAFSLSPSIPGSTGFAVVDDFFAVPEPSRLGDVPGTSSRNDADATGPADIPLAWQTPECLAEFEALRVACTDRNQISSDCVDIAAHEGGDTPSIAEGRAAHATQELIDDWGSLGLDMDLSFEDVLGA